MSLSQQLQDSKHSDRRMSFLRATEICIFGIILRRNIDDLGEEITTFKSCEKIEVF